MPFDEPLADDLWVARCVARLVELDPQLDPELARPIAEDMCSRPRWHRMGPEGAASTVFGLNGRPGG